MAKGSITRYSTEARKWSRLNQGQAISVLGAQDGDTVVLDLDDGEAQATEVTATAGVYRIKITGADAYLRIGKDAVADETGEPWDDGETDLRFLAAGERLSIVKAS